MSISEQSLSSRLSLAPEMIIDGRYHLKKLLGAGGGGEVWEATEAVDAEAWRSIALKLLKTPDRGTRHTPSASPFPEPGHDWLHEARAVSQVSCDALPHIHTVGVTGSPAIPFIAMELLEGETLDKRLDRGPIYWRRALAIAKQIAVALDACHEAGVIHCDLKPRNVFLEQVRGKRVLVLDFGVASLGGVVAAVSRLERGTGAGPRSAEETDVQAPAPSSTPEVVAAPPIIGTPAYISPERLTGNLPEHRDDAFALGVVLYRMIAGRLPQHLPPGADTASSSLGYKGQSSYEIALHRATVERMFDTLDAVVLGTPRAVATLVATLLGPASERPPKGQLAKFVDEVYHRPHGRPEVPYAGLEAFGERRIGSLPGRASDIEPIVRRLEEQMGLVLCGPSGAGKSSLAVAGVAARVDEDMLLGTDGWVPVVLRPSSARGLSLAAHDGGRVEDGPSIGTFVVVDQLEEVLSLDGEEQRAFCRAFSALVTRSAAVNAGERFIRPVDAVRVVATVRDDLFGRVAALPELDRLPERNLYVVRGVDPNAAREIVIGPLEGTGHRLDEVEGVDVVSDVARELERDSSALPLVQFALARLWDRRDTEGRVLHARYWKDIGGIMGALGDAAQGLFDALDPSQRQAARRLFLALFDVDGTRNVVDEAALDTAAVVLVPRLVAEGLVRRRADAGGRAVIEPLHEALAKGWSQLSRWLDEVRADRELARDVERDAKRWERHGQPADMLWRGTLLKNTDVLGAIREEPGRAFVVASLAATERARWRERRGRIGVVVAVAAVVVAGGVGTAVYVNNVTAARKEAEKNLTAAQANEKRAQDKEAEAKAEAARADKEKSEAEAARADVDRARANYKTDLEGLRAEMIQKANDPQALRALAKRVAESEGKVVVDPTRKPGIGSAIPPPD